jgi:hypothetical protein
MEWKLDVLVVGIVRDIATQQQTAKKDHQTRSKHGVTVLPRGRRPYKETYKNGL